MNLTSRRALVFSLDEGYIIPFRVAVGSIFPSQCATSPPLFILFESDRLSDSAIEQTLAFLKDRSLHAEFIDCRNFLPDGLPLKSSDHVSKATFYRLFLASLLPSNVDSAVYLDLDLVAIRGIDELFEVPLRHPIAAADHMSPVLSFQCHGPAGGSYFNAGVLLIDLAWWRRSDIENRFLEVLAKERHRIRWWDQDVLNLAFTDDWQRLPVWYNVTSSVLDALGPKDCLLQGRILHFDGTNKPWTASTYHPYARIWLASYSEVFGTSFDSKPSIRNRLGRMRRRAEEAVYMKLRSRR